MADQHIADKQCTLFSITLLIEAIRSHKLKRTQTQYDRAFCKKNSLDGNQRGCLDSIPDLTIFTHRIVYSCQDRKVKKCLTEI